VFIEANDDGGDNWTIGAISVQSSSQISPPTNQHPVFYRPDALPVTQPTVSKHWSTALVLLHCGSKENVPTLADYKYDPVQSILITFSKLFVNDHKSCLVVKFSTSPHICCHYTLWNAMLYFALITLLIAKNAPTLDHHNFNKR